MSVDLHGVSKRFQDVRGEERVVLKDVNLTLPEKSFTCLLGPSGCGKTTLMNLMAGFDQQSGVPANRNAQHVCPVTVRDTGANNGAGIQVLLGPVPVTDT